MNYKKKLVPAVIVIAILISVLGFVSFIETDQNQSEEEWIQLFNGQDLSGWTPKIKGFPLGENHKNTLRVEDSLLTISYDEYESFDNKFGHIFYKDKFSHYRLRAEYRFVGEQVKGGPNWAVRNNGLMLHSQSPESMGIHQDFPICIEMQLLGGLGTDERSTGNLCTPGTSVFLEDTFYVPHIKNSSSKTYHGDQWVNVEAVVLGDSIFHHIVEQDIVLSYSKPVMGGGFIAGYDPELMIEGQDVSDGYITIQAESHPTQFRKIELLNLCGCKDPKAKNYKTYYVKDDRSKCVY